ncbi:MAG: hypothetical protein C0598_14655 [Marinilabiliales bacterium]|nr:MAG: hypothetical protein C0598_14655 [Marinilabiliales bacterium]
MSDVEKSISVSGKQTEALVLSLTGDLSIQNADEVKSTLMQYVEETNKLIIDCNKLESIDLSILQLIISLITERNNNTYYSEIHYSDNELITQFFKKTGFSDLFSKITKSTKND